MPIEFTPEELRQIEISLEVKRRERAEIAAENIAWACSQGNHVGEDGKCAHCGVVLAPPEPPKKKSFSPIE